MRTANLVGVFSVLTVFGLGLGGCAMETTTEPVDGAGAGQFNGGGGGGSGAGFTAFQNGLYAFTISQNCVKCHGAFQAPEFALPDVNAAYNIAKGNRNNGTAKLVDFSNPDASIFITYAGNNHCGDPACANPANSPVVQAMIEQWALAETGAAPIGGSGTTAPPPKYVTATVALPATIPALNSATVPAVVRFNLSGLNLPIATLNNAVFEVEIQKANATEYRVARAKIAGNSAAIVITGIHVFIKGSGETGIGTEDTNQGNIWAKDVLNAAIVAKPNPLPAGPMNVTVLEATGLGIPLKSGADMMTIGFDNLQ